MSVTGSVQASWTRREPCHEASYPWASWRSAVLVGCNVVFALHAPCACRPIPLHGIYQCALACLSAADVKSLRSCSGTAQCPARHAIVGTRHHAFWPPAKLLVTQANSTPTYPHSPCRTPQPRQEACAVVSLNPDAGLIADFQHDDHPGLRHRAPLRMLALLPERIMACALCAMSDASNQNTMSVSSLSGMRMRVCLDILWPIPIHYLRGSRMSGLLYGLLDVIAARMPFGLLP